MNTRTTRTKQNEAKRQTENIQDTPKKRQRITSKTNVKSAKPTKSTLEPAEFSPEPAEPAQPVDSSTEEKEDEEEIPQPVKNNIQNKSRSSARYVRIFHSSLCISMYI